MEGYSYEITLDINESQSTVTLPIKVGDENRTVGISLVKGAEPYVLKVGTIACVEANKGNKQFLGSCIVIGNKIICNLSDMVDADSISFTSTEGVADCEVKIIYSENGEVTSVASAYFTVIVDPRVVGSDTVQYKEYPYEAFAKSVSDYLTAEENRAKAETARQATFEENEAERKTTFDTNETNRQATFEDSEKVRNAISYGKYTNLLKDIAEDSTTDFPTQFPYKKTGVYYEAGVNSLYKHATDNCYIMDVVEGERYNVSNLVFGGTSTYILDSNRSVIKSIGASSTNNLFGGLEAIPANAKYLILHTTGDSDTPYVTKVSEPIITNGTTVFNATKFIAQQKRGANHLYYDGAEGTTLKSVYISDTFNGNARYMFASGVYPLIPGKEYVICYNDSEIPQYGFCGYICSEDFTINNRIVKEDLDSCAKYVFTATENDKYLALNCFDFDGNLQLGESRATGISKFVKIGNALFDGKNDISLGDIGGIDRSLNDKNWVSYGDSITWGSTIGSSEKRWQDYIVERYGIGSHTNMGIGSTAIAYKDGVSTTDYPPMCSDGRLNNLIAKKPDIVTILGGANDLSYDIPIGADTDIVSKNTSTFKGAYAYIIDKILTAKPDTIIVLLGMYLAMNFIEARTHTLKEYANATREVAEYFGLPFVDLNECGFNTYNFNTTNAIFSNDNVHPNAEGVKRVAMVVSKWFDTFKGTVLHQTILSRSNTDYLYESFGIDKATFPYVMVGCTDKGNGNVTCGIWFANKFSDTNGRVIIPTGRSFKRATSISIVADILVQDDICTKIVEKNPSLSQGTASSQPAYTDAGTTVYYTNDKTDTFSFVPEYLS